MDIDPQAVEVTKLSLLLKVLEGESEETLANQLRLFHERALPDLADNIKCGNSLIGPDYYNGHQLNMLDEEERYRINVFDWKAEFPAIFKAGRVRRRDRESALRLDPDNERTWSRRGQVLQFALLLGRRRELRHLRCVRRTRIVPSEFVRSPWFHSAEQVFFDRLWWTVARSAVANARLGGDSRLPARTGFRTGNDLHLPALLVACAARFAEYAVCSPPQVIQEGSPTGFSVELTR